jgi:polar amino acid transport system substrate-binding protein
MVETCYSRRGALTLGLSAAAALSCPARSWASVGPAITSTDGSFDRLKSAGVLTFGTSNDQPFDFLDPTTGKIEGIDAEMLLAMLGKLGIPKHTAIQVDFDGLIGSLVGGRIEMIADAMYITDERKKVISFSDGWYQYGETLLVKKGNPANLHSLKDLSNGVKAGATLGTVYLDWLNAIPGAKVSSYPDDASVMQDLAIGRTQAVLLDAPVAGYAMRTNPKYAAEFEMVSDYTPKEIGVIGSGFRQSDVALLQAFNWALAEIKKDGTDLKILQSWGLSAINRVPVA